MFDLRRYYSKLNTPIMESYEATLSKIRDICLETENEHSCKSEYLSFFNILGKFILKLAELEKRISPEYFTNTAFEELLRENNSLYEELQPHNYETSYVNPAYGVKVFGDRFGQLISYFYFTYRSYIDYAFLHKVYKMEEGNKCFIEAYSYINSCGRPDYEALRTIMTKPQRQNLLRDDIDNILILFSKDFGYRLSILENAYSEDLRYIFMYGAYITENEINLARFIAGYPKDKIKALAEYVADAYIYGFKRDNKEKALSKRHTSKILYHIGMEPLAAQIIESLKKHGQDCIVGKISSTEVNEQHEIDHKFDNTLYLDDEYVRLKSDSYRMAAEHCSEAMGDFAGVLAIRTFGSVPFDFKDKKESLSLSREQLPLFRKLRANNSDTVSRHAPAIEHSYCILAFPTPEIGDRFEEIFDAIMEINMMDNGKYERIHQHIIDVLDSAKYVHIKGSGGNHTDIRVSLPQLADPRTQSNFNSCTADVNIPVGEVFTSPRLKDTEGVLHCEEVFLRGIKYSNLRLAFKDGFVTEYSCGNFEAPQAGRRFIEENLLFPHATLPIGEFAIGTNTLAYVVAKKYGIANILPILIAEKMGPHFAVGDTCYGRVEDLPIYNVLNGKEIVARDNEKTILRKTNPSEAYTNVHTDITLPYDSLEFISAISKEGKAVDIIRDGRFVLPGTEELNEAFERQL